MGWLGEGCFNQVTLNHPTSHCLPEHIAASEAIIEVDSGARDVEDHIPF